MSTTRSCFLQVTNKWGSDITNMSLTRSTSAAGSTVTISEPSLANGATSYKVQITFETGMAPSYDYWNVSFTDEHGTIWRTPHNDRCNISSEDEGTTVTCTIYDDQNGKHLNVGVVDGCDFVIEKK